jgi:hypothetical protein
MKTTAGRGRMLPRLFISEFVGTLIAATLAPTASYAMPLYDGLWSVSIVTTKGDCVAASRYRMRIADGVLTDDGNLAVNISGKVAASGAVIVTVSRGDTRAAGSGHLHRSVGRGSWSGASCSGLWTAERRSS